VSSWPKRPANIWVFLHALALAAGLSCEWFDRRSFAKDIDDEEGGAALTWD
jgi:hypothetical protein